MQNWQMKYTSREYASYYAGKHEGTISRRISNVCERSMMRRSLGRIRRKAPFHTVLDCPSGTGRFLPTLAPMNVSVITMDTSPAMLQEGSRHYGLFREPPRAVVGSALEVPLPENAVDVVFCARLLHHFADSQSRVQILQEFSRVARIGVVVSFFDTDCFRAWKRRRKARRKGTIGGRHTMTRDQCRGEGESAGLRIVAFDALLRYHTEITAAAFLVGSSTNP